jgi:hypothetical protein
MDIVGGEPCHNPGEQRLPLLDLVHHLSQTELIRLVTEILADHAQDRLGIADIVGTPRHAGILPDVEHTLIIELEDRARFEPRGDAQTIDGQWADILREEHVNCPSIPAGRAGRTAICSFPPRTVSYCIAR